MAADEVMAAELRFLRGDIGDIKTTLGRMTDAITKLALVEQQQSQIGEALERAFASIEKINTRLTVSLDSLEGRVKIVEQTMPQHTEVAKWVDRALVALAGVGAALVAKATGVLG